MAELNQRQEKFLKAMLSSASIDEACAQAGINRNTGYKYLKDEEFLKEYRQLRREAMQQVTSQLQKVSEQAVKTLQGIMVDEGSSSASARAQAAKIVLDAAYRSLEVDDLQEQLEDIKKKLPSSE